MTATVDRQLKIGFQLRLIDYLVLTALQTSEARPYLLSEVARNLLVHATTVALATDRLVARGLVTRQGDPRDRRATLVTITAEGRALAAAATASLSRVDFGLPGLTQDEMTSLIDIANRLSTDDSEVEEA
jgi:DNA-binding MarR family transcriptional regulator